MEGTVCVMCLAQKVVGKKKAVGLGGQEVHNFGWINFGCIGCWVRSLNMSSYFGVWLRLWFFILILYGFEGVCDCGSGREKRGSRIMSEMFVNI